MEAIFDDRTSTWNIYPDGPADYDFKKEQEVDSVGLGVQQQQQQQQQHQHQHQHQQQGGYIIHLANNAYRLTTKKKSLNTIMPQQDGQ